MNLPSHKIASDYVQDVIKITIIFASKSYMDNVYTREALCKLVDILRTNDNVIAMINHCHTFEGILTACGGICPPSLSFIDCIKAQEIMANWYTFGKLVLSKNVVHTVDEYLNLAVYYLWADKMFEEICIS